LGKKEKHLKISKLTYHANSNLHFPKTFHKNFELELTSRVKVQSEIKFDFFTTTF
jgi:hypothetical protein